MIPRAQRRFRYTLTAQRRVHPQHVYWVKLFLEDLKIGFPGDPHGQVLKIKLVSAKEIWYHTKHAKYGRGPFSGIFQCGKRRRDHKHYRPRIYVATGRHRKTAYRKLLQTLAHELEHYHQYCTTRAPHEYGVTALARNRVDRYLRWVRAGRPLPWR